MAETSNPSSTTWATIATPWYPTPYNRMAGSFVAEHARMVARIAQPQGQAQGSVRVVHGLEWPGGTAEAAVALRPSFDGLLDRLRSTGGYRLTGAVGPVDRVPVFTVGGSTWAQRAEALVRDVRRGVAPVESPIVHGHVGYLGGLLAARLADPSAAVFATEHSSALRDVLADPQSVDQYTELVERATAVFCVSGHLRDQLLERVPDPHGRVQVLNNPVDFAGVPRRATAPERLSRWLFIGGLHDGKGVTRLLKAFLIAAREDDDVTLTMIGGGALADQLRATAVEAGLGDRFEVTGVLRHSEVLQRLPQYDLLLAPSTYETFHLAVPEAVAAGLPVIVTRSGGPQETLRGVEDQVGRFVDVEDSPDQLVDAWRDLSKNLDTLDVDAARATLDARYGVEASTARLAQIYGVAGSADIPAGADHAADASESVAVQAVPERVVVLAVSGWRRYSVDAELAAAARLAVPIAVVATDPQIAQWSSGLTVVAPKAVPLLGAARPVQAPQPLAVRARRTAGRLKRQLRSANASRR